MRVCFLFDPGNADGTLGGAELTMREFLQAAPDQIRFTPVEDAEAVVIGNCVTLGAETIQTLRGKRVIRYHSDLARHEPAELRTWLEQNATHIFTSALHQDSYGLDGAWPNIPPALDLSAYKPKSAKREGTCSIAAWQNPGKGGHLLLEWAEEHGAVDVYGPGPFKPKRDGLLADCGNLEPDEVARTLWGYERFVFLPSAIEPFGRCVVEAWAAGCEVIANRNVGALHYIKSEPEALENAAERFWEVVRG